MPPCLAFQSQHRQRGGDDDRAVTAMEWRPDRNFSDLCDGDVAEAAEAYCRGAWADASLGPDRAAAPGSRPDPEPGADSQSGRRFVGDRVEFCSGLRRGKSERAGMEPAMTENDGGGEFGIASDPVLKPSEKAFPMAGGAAGVAGAAPSGAEDAKKGAAGSASNPAVEPSETASSAAGGAEEGTVGIMPGSILEAGAVPSTAEDAKEEAAVTAHNSTSESLGTASPTEEDEEEVADSILDGAEAAPSTGEDIKEEAAGAAPDPTLDPPETASPMEEEAEEGILEPGAGPSTGEGVEEEEEAGAAPDPSFDPLETASLGAEGAEEGILEPGAAPSVAKDVREEAAESAFNSTLDPLETASLEAEGGKEGISEAGAAPSTAKDVNEEAAKIASNPLLEQGRIPALIARVTDEAASIAPDSLLDQAEAPATTGGTGEGANNAVLDVPAMMVDPKEEESGVAPTPPLEQTGASRANAAGTKGEDSSEGSGSPPFQAGTAPGAGAEDEAAGVVEFPHLEREERAQATTSEAKEGAAAPVPVSSPEPAGAAPATATGGKEGAAKPVLDSLPEQAEAAPSMMGGVEEVAANVVRDAPLEPVETAPAVAFSPAVDAAGGAATLGPRTVDTPSADSVVSDSSQSSSGDGKDPKRKIDSLSSPSSSFELEEISEEPPKKKLRPLLERDVSIESSSGPKVDAAAEAVVIVANSITEPLMAEHAKGEATIASNLVLEREAAPAMRSAAKEEADEVAPGLLLERSADAEIGIVPKVDLARSEGPPPGAVAVNDEDGDGGRDKGDRLCDGQKRCNGDGGQEASPATASAAKEGATEVAPGSLSEPAKTNAEIGLGPKVDSAKSEGPPPGAAANDGGERGKGDRHRVGQKMCGGDEDHIANLYGRCRALAHRRILDSQRGLTLAQLKRQARLKARAGRSKPPPRRAWSKKKKKGKFARKKKKGKPPAKGGGGAPEAEPVEVVEMSTGVLRLYRGESPRAEFARRK